MNAGDFTFFRFALDRRGIKESPWPSNMFTTNGQTSADGSRWDDGRPLRRHSMGNSTADAVSRIICYHPIRGHEEPDRVLIKKR